MKLSVVTLVIAITVCVHSKGTKTPPPIQNCDMVKRNIIDCIDDNAASPFRDICKKDGNVSACCLAESCSATYQFGHRNCPDLCRP
ncbi:hypothetical protein NX059_005085 [Plenodomus lindquistii]|nr:hypothetical protein NX059_005085 [Plenodomus lindquistii]